jgi:hypothetical protein
VAHLLYGLCLVALTTALAFRLGRRQPGVAGAALARGAGGLLEWVGLTVVLALANIAVGVGVSVLVRVVGVFLSSYYAADTSVVGLSAVQAYLLQRWLDSPSGDAARQTDH